MKKLLYVYKCMGIIEQNEWRNKSIFATIIIMLAGLLISRLVLTVSLFAFLGLTLLHRDFISQCRSFFKTPFLACLSLLFFIPFVSGLWSSDMHEYLAVLRIKLPFLLLPLAFAGQWRLTEKQWRLIAYSFILFAAVGCCWSLLAYIQDMAAINESYLRAKTLPTPLGDDHVRFSWLISIAALLSLFLFTTEKSKRICWILGIGLCLFVVYLHVLSARTGLVLFYVLLIGFCFYRLRANRKQTVVIVITLVLLSATSWWLLPTLQNRIRYNLYDLSQIRSHTYRTGMSDGNRLISLKASWSLLQEHPFGVGAGDIRAETGNWYKENVPAMQESDKLYPSSEWMVYGNIAGWPGILIFTFIILYPLCIKNIAHRFYWIMLNLMAGLSFVIETSLEIQYGVFLYAFCALWWWKWLTFEKQLFLKHD